jgi:methylmalonyl-CoA mutase N-terminal domain/subunit
MAVSAPARTNLNDRVYETLKSRLVQRELGPGEKVSLHELAASLGVSRSPVHHALTRLVAEGLLTVKSRRGYYVTSLTEAAIAEGYDVRLALELQAAESAVGHVGSDALRRFRELHEATAAAVSHAEWDSANAAFHEHQVDLAGNALLSRFYRDLSVNLMMQVIRGGRPRSARTSAPAGGSRWRRSRRREECSSITRVKRETDSGIEIQPVYGEGEQPGEFPFTRGPYPDMYRGRPWTIRQYAGFGSAEETNARFRYLLDRGQTGLSVAFDLPTQLGYDSDDPHALGEVGRTGVAIDSLEDMRLLLGGIPLDEVSTSMTINAPASLLLLLYELVAEEQGVPGTALRGTVQNDILKEYIARGNYIYPPRPSMRLTTDLFAYAAERIPSWNTISISGYHIREAGSTAVQELAFTLANGIAYAQAAVDAGLSPDDFGARLSFFFNAHNHFFQEVAKFRAARRLWATIMRDRFGATNPKALALRFHAQTGGSTLTAQQPENNIVRVAIQALSAVAGGAQSLHTNGFDEALALPTERSARIALRTQQILAAEAGGTDTADPLGGSYFIESFTDELEEGARELIRRIDDLGGAVAAVEQGFVQREIEDAAFRWNQQVESGERVIVGVNRFAESEEEHVELHRLDPAIERRQLERTARVRAERNAEEAERALEAVRAAARGTENMLPPMREALRARVTVGEISNVLREEWGTFDASRA